jgi:hypothetical protein
MVAVTVVKSRKGDGLGLVNLDQAVVIGMCDFVASSLFGVMLGIVMNLRQSSRRFKSERTTWLL